MFTVDAGFFSKETKMTKRETIMSWLFTLLMGSLVCSSFVGPEPLLILIYVLVAGIASLPYLLISYFYLTSKQLNFFKFQLFHAGVALISILTGKAIQGDSEDYLFAGIPFYGLVMVYFVSGVLIQAIMFYRKRT